MQWIETAKETWGHIRVAPNDQTRTALAHFITLISRTSIRLHVERTDSNPNIGLPSLQLKNTFTRNSTSNIPLPTPLTLALSNLNLSCLDADPAVQ